MALQPIIIASSTFDYRIMVTDTTGVYSSTNVTGYNSPNYGISDFDSITIRVSLPDSITLLPDSTNYVDIVSPSGFPNTSGVPYYINNEALGGDADSYIPDGIYQIDLILTDTTTDPDTTYTASVYVAMAEGARCCKNKAGLKINPYKCSCGKSDRTTFDELCYLLDQVTTGVEAPNITHAAKALLRATELCSSTGCKC